MTTEEIEETASILEEIVGKSFHDVVVNVLERDYSSDEWDVSDDEIKAIKDELIKLLKQ